MGALAFAAALTLSLCIGWSISEDGHLTPESGVDYGLGMVGAITMLVLRLYPMREWTKARRRLGRLRGWFRVHVLLGVVARPSTKARRVCLAHGASC